MKAKPDKTIKPGSLSSSALVRPFGRDKTAEWKHRQMISTALEDIKNAATEAEECLTRDDEGGYKIDQAISALDDLETAWSSLLRANSVICKPTC